MTASASATATALFVNHATSPCSACSLIFRRSCTVSDSYEGLPHRFERIYATELGSVQIIYGIGWRLTGRGPLQTLKRRSDHFKPRAAYFAASKDLSRQMLDLGAQGLALLAR